MPGVHSTGPPSEVMQQLSRLSPEIPRIDILEHDEPENQIGNNLFDMFASQFSASNATISSTTNISSFLHDKPGFPEVSVFPEHSVQATTAAAAGRGVEHGFDSFQFLGHSLFRDREKELEEDPGTLTLQASPSSVEIEAPITKLMWNEYEEEPHYSDGEQQRVSYESLDTKNKTGSNDNNNKNNNIKSSFTSFKANSSWGASRSSSALTKPKRKRSKPCKSSEEVESQRMTHIAVERNRRRQMNEHLRVLRALMPGFYVQRGDQASIIGGAIEFVKELQQILQCLEDQKKRKMSFAEAATPGRLPVIQTISGFPSRAPDAKFFDGGVFEAPVTREVYGEAKSELADVEVKIVNGVSAYIRILSQKKPGQLLKTMTMLESKLLLTIVHINVTTIEPSVLYSFEVKIGQNCGFADEIAAFIHDALSSSFSSSSHGSLEEFRSFSGTSKVVN